MACGVGGRASRCGDRRRGARGHGAVAGQWRRIGRPYGTCAAPSARLRRARDQLRSEGNLCRALNWSGAVPHAPHVQFRLLRYAQAAQFPEGLTESGCPRLKVSGGDGVGATGDGGQVSGREATVRWSLTGATAAYWKGRELVGPARAARGSRTGPRAATVCRHPRSRPLDLTSGSFSRCRPCLRSPASTSARGRLTPARAHQTRRRPKSRPRRPRRPGAMAKPASSTRTAPTTSRAPWTAMTRVTPRNGPTPAAQRSAARQRDHWRAASWSAWRSAKETPAPHTRRGPACPATGLRAALVVASMRAAIGRVGPCVRPRVCAAGASRTRLSAPTMAPVSRRA